MEFRQEDFQEEEALLADDRMKVSAVAVILAILLAFALIFWCANAHAGEYTDDQIADAIRKAEGTWTYGVKTIACKTEKDCRKICVNTIKNNRKRYREHGRLEYQDYLSYLASRYAPVGAKNDPKGLNKNWLKNVKWFLDHE